MKKYELAYSKYLEAYRKSQNLELEYENNPKLKVRSNEIFEAENECMILGKEATDIFLEESKKTTIGYSKTFCNILIESVKNNDWEKHFLVRYFYKKSEIDFDISDTICWCIEEVLRKEILITKFKKGEIEWSKGSILEELVKILNVNMNRMKITKTLNKVLNQTNENALENHHLRNECNSLLRYWKNQ